MNIEIEMCQIHTCASTEWLSGEEESSSQCLLGKNNDGRGRGGAVVSEGHEGMASRGDYTVSQSASATNDLQLVRCLTQSDNATTHQLRLRQGAVTVSQGRQLLKGHGF